MSTKATHERHLPVLCDACVDLLRPALEKPGAICIDATLGMGGHSEALISALPQIRVIGIDRDSEAIELASARLASFGDRFTAVHLTYDQIPQVAEQYGNNGKVDGVLMDLGVSSLQLDEADRGFAYAQDAPLDMRMDQSRGISAAQLLATAQPAELTRILRVWGEEKYAPRIVDAIVKARQTTELTRTSQLVELIREALPQAAMRNGGHPAKRTFQALRIAVNEEISIIQAALPGAIESLTVGGRIVVESYHSLEDRLVKQAFRAGSQISAPSDLPVVPQEYLPYLRLLTNGAYKANPQELAHNPRSASVRLRAAERVRPTPRHLQPKLTSRS